MHEPREQPEAVGLQVEAQQPLVLEVTQEVAALDGLGREVDQRHGMELTLARGVLAGAGDVQHRQRGTPDPGLFERGQFSAFDLRLTVTETSPLDVLSALARGDKPRVRIEGDVQLAAEVNWLIDNVRWDAEEDLARLIGDAPAHTLAVLGRQALAAMRSFVASKAPAAAGGAA